MDSPSDPVVQPSATANGQSPGKLLAAGRKSRELTVDEVGDALNLAPQTVSLLEADDFAALPAAAFTQGYIRNYAKLVGLDADLVVSAYQSVAGKPAVEWESPRAAAGIAELVQRYPGVLISAVVAAVVLLILLILILVWPEDDENEAEADPLGIEQDVFSGAGEPETGNAGRNGAARNRDGAGVSKGDAVSNEDGAVSNKDGAVSNKDGAAARTDRSNRANTTAGSNSGRRFDAPSKASAESADGFDRDAIDPNDPLAHLPLAKTYPADASTDYSQPSPAPSESSSTTGEVTSDANYPLTVTRRLTPSGNDQIRVEVADDCWVAISSAQGNSLFGMLARPGQTLNLTGAGPFRVKLGYAAGIELYFNDEPVLLEPYTRNDVASLVIGQ